MTARRDLLAGAAALALGAPVAGALGLLAGCAGARSAPSSAGPSAGSGAPAGPSAGSAAPAGSSAGSGSHGSAAPGGAPATGLPPEIVSGPPDRPLVALTLHGQGDPALTQQLLTVCERAGARVTVLAVGQWLAGSPQLAGRILGGGHELGNHTSTHPDLGALDPAAMFAEIDGCARVLHRLTGSIGSWFRPSRTRSAGPAIRAAAARAGYPSCLSYSLDALDYIDPGPAAVTGTVLAGVRPGAIVSLHCGHPGTVTALPGILAGLTARGLRAVGVSELIRR